ncbi:MAG TPA: hypothetical protein DCM10_09810 [Xanthomarina gelatinilytica]|nr:hypothetical protein [Xanthomarina gelatinilytica]
MKVTAVVIPSNIIPPIEETLLENESQALCKGPNKSMLLILSNKPPIVLDQTVDIKPVKKIQASIKKEKSGLIIQAKASKTTL